MLQYSFSSISGTLQQTVSFHPENCLHLSLLILRTEETFVGESDTSLQRNHDILWFRLVKLGLMNITSPNASTEKHPLL
ncbi:hypothetical protein CCP3SC5AM1_1990002 [Gammaproteobacteria bacterium]